MKKVLEPQDSIDNMHGTLQGRYDQILKFQNPELWQKTASGGASFQNSNREAFLDYLESGVRMKAKAVSLKSDSRKRAATVEGTEVKG